MLDFLKRTPTITLDTDWLWRVAGPVAARIFGGALTHSRERLEDNLASGARVLSTKFIQQLRPGGLLLRSWPTGNMSLWVMVMLLAYLALYYI